MNMVEGFEQQPSLDHFGSSEKVTKLTLFGIRLKFK